VSIVQSPEVRLQAILDTCVDAVFCVDAAGRILDWNKQAELLLGWPQQEILGQQFTSFLLPISLREQLSKRLNDRCSAESVEFRLLHCAATDKAGTEFPIELSIQPLCTSLAILFIVEVRPWTGQDRIASKSPRSGILDQLGEGLRSHDAVIRASFDGLITEWNSGAEAIYGYLADEALGQPVSIIVPDHLQHIESELALVQRFGIRLNQFETVRRRKDGKIINVSMTVTPVHNAAGQIIGTSSTERDTTHRQRREVQLQRATRDSESATRTQNEFLANISHELRTPMNVIIGMVELTLGTNSLSPAAHDYLETANQSARDLLLLLEDLLDFSHMEAGSNDLKSQPFSLRSTLESALQPLTLLARERGLKLFCEIQAEVPDQLEGDARRLRQVVTQLLRNAIKYTEQGEVELRISVERQTNADVQLFVAVRDTGIGIALDDQERIFAPFTQADASSTRRYAGTGLGLFICRLLIERMHGRIWLESKPGRGTTFYCTPRLRTIQTPESCDAQPAMPDTRRSTPSTDVAGTRSRKSADADAETSTIHSELRILVAEDTPANQRVVRAILERRGHQIDIAHNGREAVDLHQRSHYDAILMDIQMPTMDGFQATSAIRSLKKDLAAVPIIAMTAHAMHGDRQRCLDAGMNDYISKPIDSRRIVQLLEKVTREHRLAHNSQSGNAAAVQMQMQQGSSGSQSEDRPVRIDSVTVAPYVRTYMSTPEIRSNLLQDSTKNAALPTKTPNTDKPVLNVACALSRLGGDRALLVDMARFFLEDSALLMSDLERALDRDDPDQALRNAHSLRGLAANFNAEPCVAIAQIIEDAAKQRKLDSERKLDSIRPRFNTLRTEVARLVEALQREVLSAE
jgi:PAS domain S-box-containing protein